MNDTANTGYLLYEKMASFTGAKNLSLDIPSSASRFSPTEKKINCDQ